MNEAELSQESSCKAVRDHLRHIPEVSQIQHISAEVPIIKCIYQGIGIDISFSQPNGIITTYMLEVFDGYIGRNHLLKRSFVLI